VLAGVDQDFIEISANFPGNRGAFDELRAGADDGGDGFQILL